MNLIYIAIPVSGLSTRVLHNKAERRTAAAVMIVFNISGTVLIHTA